MEADDNHFKSRQLVSGPRHRKRSKQSKNKKLLWIIPVLAVIVAAACIAAFSGGTVFSGETARASITPISSMSTMPAANTPSAVLSAAPSPTVETPQPAETSKFLAVGVQSDEWSYVSTQLNIKIEKFKEKDLSYFVVDLYCKHASNLKTVLAKDKYGNYHETVSGMAKRHDAILAINGDYYNWRTTGIIIRNGQLYRDKPKEQVAAIFPDNQLKTYLSSKTTGKALKAEGAEQSFSFGPALLKDGKAIPSFKGISNVRTFNPRTAIGQVEPGHYIIIVVNGRQRDGSKGMTMEDLSKLFEKYGCRTAYNLDGGGSSTLYFMGRILNSPTDGHERKTSDSICFIEN